MAETPNYRFNRTPEFTVNHVSEYLTTDHAVQRTKIIRAAKFPKKVEVSAYSQVRRPLQDALSRPDFDKPGLELLAGRMAAKAAREIGHPKDEAMRCEKAVRAFIETVTPKSFGSRVQIGPAPAMLSLARHGVRIKVNLDATVSCADGDDYKSGGITLLYSFAAERGSLKPRMSAITGLMLWALEGGQMEPAPKLCMAVDIAGNEIVRASASHARFRAHVEEACKEVAARWDSVEPPQDYDGPDWT